MIAGSPGAAGEPAADALAVLRAWGRGERPPAPRARALDVLAFAGRNDVVWPVCAALEQVLPEGAAALLLRPARREAELRAEALAAQFREVAAILSEAGVRPVALKGAAFIAEAGGAAVPWREMIDLDVLVEPERLRRAAEAMQAAGYHGEASAHVATDFHFPALYPPPGGVATVELHVRTGWSRRGPLAQLEARARDSAMPGMRVPAPEDRLGHLVQHAQTTERGWARRSLRLREMLDWRRIIDWGAPDLEALAKRFDAAGQGEGFRAYAALMARLWEEPAPGDWARVHARWVDETIAALADPSLAEAWRRKDAAPAAAEALTTRDLLMHAAAGALNPARLRRFLRRLRA